MNSEETSIFTAIIITVLVIGIIIVYFAVSLIKQQKRMLVLEKLNIQAEITALEKDRARIASDLHDELGPMLAAVKMKMNTFELTEQEDKENMEKTNEHIDSILKRMREITFDLMPNILFRKGLVSAIHEFITYISKKNALQINFSSSIESLILPEQQTLNLYRIVQEIIHNTIKHAEATELNIQIAVIENKLQLTTTDNGKGFDYDKKSKTAMGIGLKNLANRTEMMKGKMFIDTEKNAGTKFKFEIPVS
jgi:two-component system, NarL family, sensor kinase